MGGATKKAPLICLVFSWFGLRDTCQTASIGSESLLKSAEVEESESESEVEGSEEADSEPEEDDTC